ncbi:MAG: 50S ribosomal protein L5 [Thermodesulfobacteriota bacterium]
MAGAQPRMKKIYNEEVVPRIMERNSYSNPMRVPRLERIVLNMGLGRLSEAGRNKTVVEEAVAELALIAGQRPAVTISKKSIAGFKLREDMPIGCAVTLRGTMMYEFFDRLVNLALPRVRDFRGVNKKSFDGNGNYTLGIKEHIIFPEIDYSKVSRVKGLNITFVTTTENDGEARVLLEELGVPFSREDA